MKRILASFLAFALVAGLFPLAFSEDDTSSVHEIWGIPWGVSMDEFIDIAYQNTGLRFSPRGDDAVQCTIASSQRNAKIYGYSIRSATAYFSKDTLAYESLRVYLIDATRFVPFQTAVSTFNNVFNSLLSRYPLFQEPYFHLIRPDGPSGFHYFQLPLIENQIDQTALETICQNEASITISTKFDNITLTSFIVPHDFENRKRCVCLLSLGADSQSAQQRFTAEDYGDYFEFLEAYPTPVPAPTVAPTPKPTPFSFNF